MTSKITHIAYQPLFDAWKSPVKETKSIARVADTTATPRSATTVATNATQGVSAPVYGSKHDQTVGIDALKNLASVTGLKMIETKSTTGGLAYETLNDAYTN